MTEREQLYAAICADTEDTTLRLAYADCLDENGDADRAEFIRVQCEWECMTHGCTVVLGKPCVGSVPEWCLACRLKVREKELLDTHPEWRTCPCPECDGSGTQEKLNGHDGLTCPTCGGTGDLFRVSRRWIQEDPDYGEQHRNDVTPRTVTFRNGFPDSVTCTLEEIGKECPVWRSFCGTPPHPQCSRCSGIGLTPSPWAAAVVRTTPVTRFADFSSPTLEEGGWEWYGLPDWLNVPEMKQTFRTEIDARDALASVAGRVVRQSVYKKEVDRGHAQEG